MEIGNGLTLAVTFLTLVSVIGGFAFTWGRQAENQVNTNARLRRIEDKLDTDIFVKRVEFDREMEHIRVKLEELTKGQENT